MTHVCFFGCTDERGFTERLVSDAGRTTYPFSCGHANYFRVFQSPLAARAGRGGLVAIESATLQATEDHPAVNMNRRHQ